MALVNDAKKEIHAKIVYMGPKGSGKGSALRYIYSKLKPEYRSELKIIPAGGHQMLFFDFIYPQGSASTGYSLRFHLYTLLAADDTIPPWKMLLKGADGLVFLAGSAPEMLAGNIDNASLLRESLAHYGMELVDTPLSVQGSCTNMKVASKGSGLLSELFPEWGSAGRMVNVATGEGVLEGLHALIKLVLPRIGQSVDGSEESAENGAVQEAKFCVEASVPDTDKSIGKGTRFHVETAGETSCDKKGVISVPLRLVNSSGEASALLTLKISLSL